MKKLYRKGTVHPSPPIISGHLSFLPATLLTLTAVLSPEDREVLAYLISCSNNHSIIIDKNQRKATGQRSSSLYNDNSKNNNTGKDHPPLFNCDCFRCYMSYWVRWDSSPNRQLIHEIIDAFEEQLSMMQGKNSKNNKKGMRKRQKKGNYSTANSSSELSVVDELKDKVMTSESLALPLAEEHCVSGDDDIGGGDQDAEEDANLEKGSVRRLVSFIGESIWGVFGHQ